MARCITKILATILGLPMLAYALAAFLGSLIPVNRGWRQADQGVTIHVVTNGWHTGLILPASADGIDLSLVFRPTDLPDPDDAGDFMLFGWGDRDFYMNTPEWRDLSPATMLNALSGSDATLLHVDHLTRPDEAALPRPLRLTRAEYRRLVSAILATLAFRSDGYPAARPGYGSRDVFYDAKGRYTSLRTCNVWTRDMLAAAGVRVGIWTPFSGGVMRWFPG